MTTNRYSRRGIDKTDEEVKKEERLRNHASLRLLEGRIKKGEEYFGLALGEITVTIYKDLMSAQQLILALIRNNIRSTGLMVEHFNMGQENILININVLKGKGYVKSYKKLYFPIEFPDKDLKQASIDYWHKVHPVNRNTHKMRMARVEAIKKRELEALRDSQKEEVVNEEEITEAPKKRIFNSPKPKWNT